MLATFLDCSAYGTLIGDGFCNDETNNADCNYDGGDCCVNVNTDHCIECICYYEDNCVLGYTPTVVGDGFCNDETNNANCNYDGGDCCVNVNADHCTECKCYLNENCAFGFIPGVVGDGFCNDETNNFYCHYDFGDCCGYNVNNDLCSNCTCLGMAFLT